MPKPSPDEETDAELCYLARHGDRRAWRALVRRHTPMVYRLSVRMLGPGAGAEDACQEAFMKMHGSFDSYDLARPLAPWLGRITYHACLKRLSKSSRSGLPTDPLDLQHVRDGRLRRFKGLLVIRSPSRGVSQAHRTRRGGAGPATRLSLSCPWEDPMWNVCSKLLSPLLAALAAAAPAPPAPTTIPVPGVAHEATLDRGRVYLAAGSAGVQAVDLALGRVVAGRAFPGEAIEQLAVADGLVFAASADSRRPRLHVLFAKDVSLAATIDLGELGRVRDVVAISGARVAIVTGAAVTLLDTDARRVVAIVPIEGGVATSAVRLGDSLYVSRSYAGAVIRVDLTNARVAETLETPDWLTSVDVGRGDAAWTAGTIEGLGRLDLVTGAWQKIAGIGPTAARDLRARADGGVDVLVDGALLSLDSEGTTTRRLDIGGQPSAVVSAGPARVITVGAGGLTVTTRGADDA